jgi:hypothetical protein
MSGSFAMSYGPVHFPGQDPRYLESLHRRKDIIARLCTALHEYLNLDVDAALEQASRKAPKMPKPTIEDLNRAQEQLDLCHAQIEAIQNMSADMPENLRDMMRITQMPQVQRWLEEAQQRVSFIQQAMEEPDPDPLNPWDGSHRIGTMCAICAKDAGFVESSPAALKVKLKDAGWGRDSDGDHICPACFVKQQEVKS